MRKLLIPIFALLVLAPSASAQPQLEVDQRIASYRFLLGEANDRLAASNAQTVMLEAKIKALQAEVEKLKADRGK